MSYRPESKPIKDTGTSGSCLFEMALVFRLCLIAYILKRADTQVLFLLPWIYEQDRHNRNHISRLYGEGRRARCFLSDQLVFWRSRHAVFASQIGDYWRCCARLSIGIRECGSLNKRRVCGKYFRLETTLFPG
jgi:hypothetical protein